LRALHERLHFLNLMEDEDFDILDDLHAKTAVYSAGTIIQRENGPIELTRFIVSGWAIKFQTSPAGRRQILSFLIPGDSIGLYGALFQNSESGLEVIAEIMVAEIPSVELMSIFKRSPRLGAALCWIGGQDERFLHHQILRLGALRATPRLAHILIELHLRLLRVGIPPAEASIIPINQKLIGEALGITHVHANRCCRELVKMGLIETTSRRVKLLDPSELKRLCVYEENWGGAQLPPSSRRWLGGS